MSIKEVHIAVLAVAMAAGCSPSEEKSPPIGSSESGIRCASCSLNGYGVYVSNKNSNSRFGTQRAGHSEDYALLGFTNSSPAKTNWGVETPAPINYATMSLGVNSASYNGTIGYTVVSVTTNSNSTDMVVVLNGPGGTATYRGSNDPLFNASYDLTKIRFFFAHPTSTFLSYTLRFRPENPIDTTTMLTDQATDLVSGQSEYGKMMPSQAVTLTSYWMEISFDGGSNWMPYCDKGHDDGSTSVPEQMFPLKGSRIGHTNAGITASTSNTTWACKSGAIGAGLLWGFLPWRADMNHNKLASVIQMKRAAYCGLYSYTHDYEKISIGDNLPNGVAPDQHVYDPSLTDFGIGVDQILESYWSPYGARCVHKQRTDHPPQNPGQSPMFNMNPMGSDNTCGVPTCGSITLPPPSTTWDVISAQCPTL